MLMPFLAPSSQCYGYWDFGTDTAWVRNFDM